MLWLVLLVVIFGGFVWMVWRMSSGPSNEEPAIGHNLPGSSATLSHIGVYPQTVDPPLGTPESLESGDIERALEREHHRHKFDQERRN